MKTFEWLLLLALLELMILFPIGFKYAVEKESPDMSQYVHMSQDPVRICLAQCKGKAVESFWSEQNNLKCGCAK